MADPVADKSGFLRMYMSNHPDTLVAYAKWYGQVSETITSAEMSAIDSRSMTLTCILKNKEKKVVIVALNPPLSGYEEVKPRLLEMKAKAQEGLGMIKAPELKTFNLDMGVFKTISAITFLCYCTFFPRNSTSPLFLPAQNIHKVVGGDYTLKLIWATMILVHLLECFYTYSLCRKHKTGFFVSAGYVVATFLFGYPVWVEMRRRIQTLRIESVMKVE